MQQQPSRTVTQQRPENPADINIEEVLRATEDDLRKFRHQIEEAEPGLQKAARVSQALQQVRRLVTNKFITDYVIPLMTSPLGFMTDKSKGQFYSADELREPVCECLIRGFSIVGNEFNVITGRFYGAQAGYRRLVRELPGLTDLQELAGEPVFSQAGGSASVRYIVRCKINGKSWALTNENGEQGRKFTIRVNAGMGPDAVIGKAARKALKAAYEELTGTTITDMDEPEAAPADSSSPLTPGRINLTGRKPTPAPQPQPAPQADPDDPETQAEQPDDDKPISPDELDRLADIEGMEQQLANSIEEVTTILGLQKVGGDLKKFAGMLGEQRHEALMTRWRQRYSELNKK